MARPPGVCCRHPFPANGIGVTEYLLLGVFLVTYIGIALGRIPGLALDRTGVALLGAILMIEIAGLSLGEVAGLVDVSTLALLYALMVFSAQLRLGGFYTRVASGLMGLVSRPKRFLASQMAASAVLSSLLANDIICLVFAPMIARACLQAGVQPLPHLLGLAMAANIGSAATLIGNPQNMLIGQLGGLAFGDYLAWAMVPTSTSLVLAYALLRWRYRGDLERTPTHADAAVGPGGEARPFDAWQTGKGLVLLGLLVALFFTELPRDRVALILAALLLMSRRLHTRSILGLIDWHLLTFLAALFVVVGLFRQTGVLEMGMNGLAGHGLDLGQPGILTLVTAALSNLVSNVPATLLLAQFLEGAAPKSWYVLAMASTFAGNLLLIGSIANLIVAEQVSPLGIRLGFAEYARSGVPVALLSLGVLMLWAWG